MRWLGLAGLVLAIIAIIALALRYIRSGDNDDLEETRETVFTTSLLQEQLASLWRRLRQRLPRVRPDPYLSLEGEDANRREIRLLYQALLTQAKALGYPRLRPQTPIEYDAALARLAPADESAWDTMTEGYVAARYGLQAPTTKQVERMRQAWGRLQSVLASQEPIGTPTPATSPTQETRSNDDDLPMILDDDRPNT
jgi:hypothetical protein